MSNMQLLLSTICFVLTSAVVSNAYYQKKQFFPAVVYITKSNASMAVIYIQFFVIVFMFGKLLRKIFLGTLRAAEFEHLLERFWYALTETCLAFTVFRDDFNPRFVALFTVLLFLKSFHWLAEERVDFMERSPVLGWIFHIRVASLLFVLGTLDYLLFMHAYNSTLVRGPTVQLVFGFEYGILLTVVASTAIKYVLHTAEMRTDTPWENKAVFLLYTELVIGLIKVILYVLFVVIMAKIYALPMFVFRPMFFTIRNFKKALSDVIMSRRAIRNMNTLYPDATAEELRLSDNICIICREDMISHSKKLPCGHIFHTTCLRSWFQRQQTCPTCRLNILRTPANVNTRPRPEEGPELARAAAAAVGAAAVGATANNVPAGGAANATEANATLSGGIANVADAIATGLGNDNVGPVPLLTNNALPNFPFGLPGIGTAGMPPLPMPPPFMMPPPFNFMTPFAVPPPPMPPDLTNFTDDELRALEGNERQKIEERIKLLNNIKLMLDAAGVLMRNYEIVSANSQVPIPPDSTTPAANSSSTATASTSNSAEAAAASSFSSNPFAALSTPFEAAKVAAASTSTNGTKNQAAVNEVSNALSSQQTATSTPTSSHITKNPNGVTIEDLGSEDLEQDALASTSTSSLKENASKSTATTTASTSSTNVNTDSVNSELNELRERRLKYLGRE